MLVSNTAVALFTLSASVPPETTAETIREKQSATINIVHQEKEALMSDLSPQDKKSFHLFVDCVPTKSESGYERTIELADLLKPVFTKIQTEKELSHYRLASPVNTSF